MNRRAALNAARDARNDAKGRLDASLTAMRAGLEEKGVGERVTESVANKAADVIEQAVDVASANKAVVAGTLGALALWFLRNPLLALAAKTLHRDDRSMKDHDDD